MLLTGPPTDPTPTLSCAADNVVCQQVYQWTHSEALASGSNYFIVIPLRILLIVVLAALARYAANRLIERVVRGSTRDAAVPAGTDAGSGSATKSGLLRPLRARVPHAVRAAAGLLPERRRQRAEALGSALTSAASMTIFVIAAMLILDIFGVNLAPILASAGIVGLAVGFGAQNLVKDFIAGLFMLLEDQYGIGDQVDLGEVLGTVEGVGLRVTTIRDSVGVVWYIRNGEIIRVGNKSQGWSPGEPDSSHHGQP